MKQTESAENFVQALPNALKCPCVSIKHALKKQGIKTLKPLISQGFQVSASIEYISCEPPENLKELFSEGYNADDDSFEEEEMEQA